MLQIFLWLVCVRHTLICCRWNVDFFFFASCWLNMAQLWHSDNELPAIVLFSYFLMLLFRGNTASVLRNCDRMIHLFAEWKFEKLSPEAERQKVCLVAAQCMQSVLKWTCPISVSLHGGKVNVNVKAFGRLHGLISFLMLHVITIFCFNFKCLSWINLFCFVWER